MGEDITKLKKNIDAIKRIMKGGIKNDPEKTEKESTTKPK